MAELSTPAIGIDLGTTNSCVAIYLNGRAEVLANDDGERTTPSYVSFKHREILVGKPARDQAYRNIKNTIYDVKRLMGKKYNDVKVQEGMEYWPFAVTDRNGNPELKIKLGDEESFYCPEQISAKILEKLKNVASRRVEAPVTKAVITVPAYFNDAQRQATKDAGKLAGLEVLMLLNEPTAAAITYALDKNSKDCKQALIFDLGGGTFDVSIIKFENRRVTVKAIHGDSHLGGNDFDRNLLMYFVEDIQKRFNYNIRGDFVSMSRLLAECERKKRSLSFSTSVGIDLYGLVNEEDYYTELTREKFEDLNKELFHKTLEIVKNCLATASLTPSDIDNVVLVGGSTRIPRIKYLLQDLFRDTVLSETVNPDEAIAIGAAIQAANLSNNDAQAVEDFVLEDIVPFSLGIGIRGGLMSTIITRHTSLPAISLQNYTTTEDNITSAEIEIYEGEDKFYCNNNSLGSFILSGIPPAPKYSLNIIVTFDIDVNGILNVTATEDSSKNSNNITIKKDTGRLSKDELEIMIEQAETYRRGKKN